MAGPLSKAPPPPPTAEQRAQRRKQKRLVLGTLAGLLLIVAIWQVYEYRASSPQRTERQVQAAMNLLTPGKYEQAEKQLSEVIQSDPTSSNAYFQRGIARANLAALDDALSDFQRAVFLKPDLFTARTERADIFRRKGDPQDALEELNKVIEAQPTMEAYSTRASVYAELGRHADAISDFTWVIKEVRDAPLAYFGRAKSKRAMGDEAGAVEDEKNGLSFNRGRVN